MLNYTLCFQASLKGDEASEAFRVMYGGNVPNTTADIPEAIAKQAIDNDFHLLSTTISANPEQLRAPRVTRIGLIQNKWPTSTTAPLVQQREAIQSRISTMVESAGALGVQVRPQQAQHGCAPSQLHTSRAICTLVDAQQMPRATTWLPG